MATEKIGAIGNTIDDKEKVLKLAKLNTGEADTSTATHVVNAAPNSVIGPNYHVSHPGNSVFTANGSVA